MNCRRAICRCNCPACTTFQKVPSEANPQGAVMLMTWIVGLYGLTSEFTVSFVVPNITCVEDINEQGKRAPKTKKKPSGRPLILLVRRPRLTYTESADNKVPA